MDKIVSLVLILAVTDVAKCIGGYAGSFVIINAAVLSIILLYLLIHIRLVLGILANRNVFFWTTLLCIWPLATVLYNDLAISTTAVYPIYVTSCMLLCVLLCLKRGAQYMQKVFLISLFLVYAGILLSLFVPQLFLPVFELQRSTELQESFTFWGTRAFGFSLQPNAVTLNITMLIIGTVLFQQKTSKNLLHVFVGFFFIMLTGSRGGMLLYLLFLAIYITFFLKGISTSIYSTTGTKFQLRMKYVPILLFLAVLPISLYAVYSEISITTGPTVYDRWERIFAPQQSYLDENEDASVKARLQVRSEALRLAMQSPILGQGLGAMEESVRRGEIPISTHNTLLKYAIAYGIPYVLLYVFGLFFMFLRDPYRSGVNRYVQSNFFFQLVICILFASQIQSVLDRSIILHSMLGVAIGLKIMASKWMMKSHDEINGSLLLMNTAPQGNLPS